MFRLPISVTPNQEGDRIVAAGDSFNLTCDGENVVNRLWFVLHHNNSRLITLTNSSNGRIALTPDYRIILFQGIQTGDQAQYICRLINDVSFDTITVRVTVTGESVMQEGGEGRLLFWGMPICSNQSLHSESACQNLAQYTYTYFKHARMSI